MILLFAAGIVFLILLVSELLWRSGLLRGEASRKLVHIAVGLFVAYWPFIMSATQILIMSAAFLAVVIISLRVPVLHGIHGVKRKTWGEVMFPIGIALAVLLSPNKWFFAAAILHLSLADGLAAVIGEKYGKNNRYKLFGETRSVAGTLTFYVISLGVVVGIIMMSEGVFRAAAVPLLVVLPVVASLVENIAVRGTDNVAVPASVILTLGVVSGIY